jgi:hypothetical protein
MTDLDKRMTDLDKAVCAFFGKGYSPFPELDESRLPKVLGPKLAAQYLPIVLGLAEQIDEFEPDWTIDDIKSSVEKLCAEVRIQYPKIGKESEEAIFWAASYFWR